jgi:hypothetical protein
MGKTYSCWILVFPWGIVTGLQQVLGYELKTSYDVIDIAQVARYMGVADQLLQRLEAMWEHVVIPVGEINNHDVEKIRLRRYLQYKGGE